MTERPEANLLGAHARYESANYTGRRTSRPCTPTARYYELHAGNMFLFSISILINSVIFCGGQDSFYFAEQSSLKLLIILDIASIIFWFSIVIVLIIILLVFLHRILMLWIFDWMKFNWMLLGSLLYRIVFYAYFLKSYDELVHFRMNKSWIFFSMLFEETFIRFEFSFLNLILI